MTITATLTQSNTHLNRAFGSHLETAGGAKTITVGFMPRRVKWVDETNLHSWEWFSGMANGTSLRTDGSTKARTLNTAEAAISIAQDTAITDYITTGVALVGGYRPAVQKGTYVVSIAAAVAAASAQCRFEIVE